MRIDKQENENDLTIAINTVNVKVDISKLL